MVTTTMRRFPIILLSLSLRSPWLSNAFSPNGSSVSSSVTMMPRLVNAASTPPASVSATASVSERRSARETTTWLRAASTNGQQQQQQQQQHQQQHDVNSSSDQKPKPHHYQHVLAILSMPYTSMDRIANEAILETAMAHTHKLSVVLRCEGARERPSLVSLRRYVSEIYSQLWDSLLLDDTVFGGGSGGSGSSSSSGTTDTDNSDDNSDNDSAGGGLPDVVVYPQNLPNTAPESWIDIQPDLEAVCTHDTLVGWVSQEATGRGKRHYQRSGRGGLKEHVAALNAERQRRQLSPVMALAPERWPMGAQVETALDDRVIFLDDEPGTRSAMEQAALPSPQDFEGGDQGLASVVSTTTTTTVDSDGNSNDTNNIENDEKGGLTSFLSGAAISSNKILFESVAVGGTFDGLHFGHRKLLTLAISSVQPMTGRLLIGITQDEMLRNKAHAQDISSYEQRAQSVRHFLHRLAPGMLNRIKLVPITDKFGPPGKPDMFFDALVLSHEVLDTGYELNQHRAKLGLEPLYLLCTRRTEAQAMSSTTMRRARAQSSRSQSSNNNNNKSSG
mmetsp:Transcript_8637/g.23931  ORF Transcript_8637/g.23931 Transcript_8637/m.23931 type:complete len:561 (+) Transcript_8637:190-1872(+)